MICDYNDDRCLLLPPSCNCACGAFKYFFKEIIQNRISLKSTPYTQFSVYELKSLRAPGLQN